MSSRVGRLSPLAFIAETSEIDLPRAHADDLAFCASTLRAGSKSFHLASRLLPRRVREPATALYAFCRLADDAVDLPGAEADALDQLHDQLDRVYGARPADHPMERALAAVVQRYAIPRAVLDALLEGLAWDAEGRRFETFSDIASYAARVASTVGVITTLLMGVRSEAALARAADLGVAMQLTNIARDVGEDARAGRLYLPRDWMRDAGLDPDAWLAEPVFDERLRGVVARLLQAADSLYRRAEGGIAFLPLDCRPGIHAARLIYAEIGRVVDSLGDRALDVRAVVPSARKVALLTSAFASSLHGRGGDAEVEPLAETRFLVEAVRACSPPDVEAASPADLDERIGRIIDLFARLKQEEMQRTAGRR